MQLVQQATANLLSIQGLYARHLGYKMSSNSIKQLDDEKIERDFKDINIALAAQSNLKVMNCLTENIKTIEHSLLQQVKLTSEFQLLTSINGIGNVLGLTIMLETGSISRFNKVGDYASYCRCVGGARYSNDKKKGKTNTKNGNRFLAWAFVEAANFAIRFNKTIKSYYQKKLAKTNQMIAIKTVAHKLAS